MTKSSDAWDDRLLGIARAVAQWSRDPKMKVGAVIAKGNRILSTGFNGSAAGTSDPDWSDQMEKDGAVIHAEANAVLWAARNGPTIEGATLYVTHPPCARCAAMAVQAGISRVVYHRDMEPISYLSKYAASISQAVTILQEGNVAISIRSSKK